MSPHVIRWYGGDPASFRLSRVAYRGQQPLMLEQRSGEHWLPLARVASEREAERLLSQLLPKSFPEGARR